jgi:hypothetical protein
MLARSGGIKEEEFSVYANVLYLFNLSSLKNVVFGF